MIGATFAEWGKAMTLRSPLLCLAMTGPVAFVVAFALGNDALQSGQVIDPEGPASVALQLAVLVFAAAAMLIVTSEYQGGTITTSFLAQPRRSVVVAAKATVAAVLGALIGVLSGVLAYLAAAVGLTVSISPGALASLAARAAAVFALAGILVVGLGFVLRRSVGTLTGAALLLVAGVALPDATRPWTAAGGISAFLQQDSSIYAPAVGMVVLVGWAAAAVATGAVVVTRRDA